jgi:peptide/nickel transport system permease protein
VNPHKKKWSIDFKIGLVLVAAITLLSLVSFFYTPYDYTATDGTRKFAAPGFKYLLGTDNLGHDVFSRLMVGGRYTLIMALGTVASSALIGSFLGLIVGYVGGIASQVVMRIMDALSSFPGILLALVMVAILPTGPFTIVFALIILFIPGFTRIARNGMRQYKDRDFINTASIMGVSHLRIIFVHILPNVLPALLSAVVIGLSNAILAEVAMSYLGLGIQPPIPSWGRMLAEAQNYLFNAVWCAVAPGVMIMLIVMGFQFLGEGIRKRYC